MNKRIITLSAILLVASALTLGAQHIPDSAFAEDPGVGRFYDGCLKIIEGELASDPDARNEAYALAMDALNPRRKGYDAGRMKLTAVDTAGVADAPAPTLPSTSAMPAPNIRASTSPRAESHAVSAEPAACSTSPSSPAAKPRFQSASTAHAFSLPSPVLAPK